MLNSWDFVVKSTASRNGQSFKLSRFAHLPWGPQVEAAWISSGATFERISEDLLLNRWINYLRYNYIFYSDAVRRDCCLGGSFLGRWIHCDRFKFLLFYFNVRYSILDTVSLLSIWSFNDVFHTLKNNLPNILLTIYIKDYRSAF